MKRTIITLLCTMCLLSNYIAAQTQRMKVISGIVRAEDGNPLSGVLVSTPDKMVFSAISNKDGQFLMEIPESENTIICKSIGYKDENITLVSGKSIDIVLQTDFAQQDVELETALLQKSRKGSYTGAISTVQGDELVKTPNSGFSATLIGRLAGFSAIQHTNTPADDAVTMYIRGLNSINGNTPLVVLDGIPAPLFDINTLDVNTIRSISILKDAAAKALYGPRASSGVILITTKRGEQGRNKIDINIDYSLQEATKRPQTVGTGDYARMRNQALINDGKSPLYSLYEIATFTDGSIPGHNWYDEFVNKLASMQRYNVNVNGGNNRVKYLVNAGYLHQNSLINSIKQENYDPAFKLHRFNVLANIDVALHKYINCFLSTNTTIDRINQGYNNIGTIMNSIYQMAPTVEGPIDSKGNIVTTEYNENPTYGMINRTGYSHATGVNLNVAYGMNVDMGFLLRGLSMKGIVGYEANYNGTIYGATDYLRYSSAGHNLFGIHTEQPLSLTKEANMRYFISFQGLINYNRIWDKKHEIDAFIGYFNENMMKNGDLPYDRLSLSGHFKYGYKSRYYLQGDFTHYGTEQFRPGNRFKFFPTLSAAWVVSNETFLKDARWLSSLKLRASMGWLGNDQISDKRFLYATDIRYRLAGYLLSNYYAAQATEGMQGNPNIFYEKSFQQNYGIDLTLFNAFGLTFDYWKTKQTDMAVQDHSISAIRGITSENLPYENLGQMENKGFDAELSYFKKMKSGLTLTVKGNMGYNRNIVLDVRELNRAGSGYYYPYRKTGYAVGQRFGYLIDYSNGNGYYNSQTEINQRGLRFSGISPRPGDFMYQDLNNDGIIDERDLAPADNTQALPTFAYGSSVQIEYKNFDFYLQLQGVSGTAAFYGGCGIYENAYQGVYTDLHRTAWTPERYANNESIGYPALTTGSSSSLAPNNFFYSKNNYMRIRSLVIGYTLPQTWAGKLKMEKIRFYLSGSNLLTFTSLKFKHLDPEQYTYASYPLYRTFNIGLNLKF